MDEKRFNGRLFDALIEQAVIDNFYEEFNAQPSLDTLSKEFKSSISLDKRINALITRENRKERFHKILFIGRKAVAVFLIFVTLFAGVLMFNPTVRAAVVETIILWQQEFMKFFSSNEEAEGNRMIPTYIPENFQKAYYEEINYTTLLLYINETGKEIFFLANKAEGSLYVDNENASYEVLVINNITYHILSSFDSIGENTVIWEYNGWRYMLSSLYYTESLLKMALSIE